LQDSPTQMELVSVTNRRGPDPPKERETYHESGVFDVLRRHGRPYQHLMSSCLFAPWTHATLLKLSELWWLYEEIVDVSEYDVFRGDTCVSLESSASTNIRKDAIW